MRNNGFMTGVIAGAALGALFVVMMAPNAREPLMDGAGQLGNRMRKMWRRADMGKVGEMVQQAMPGTDGQ